MLVVLVDFTGKLMSIAADGVFVSWLSTLPNST
ncbi:hypothetical protein QM129_28445 [Klebsiella pneumoniae]|nr:hypothetical protein [Klebsiella pneumoniae]MDV5678120.1 hypothetical protein [Klebsiella pneumoniae]